jgi:signal transduction histidine kinase/ligand-binding sensor domain-containing protein/AraC-like DNA-binding protein
MDRLSSSPAQSAFFFSLCLAVTGVGAIHTTAQPLYFSTLSINDGLPSNIITGVAQDEGDFIWIGTSSGLARYDGYQFKTFRKSNAANSLSSNEISCLLRSGRYIWIGTWSGLNKIDTETLAITRIAGASDLAIRTLAKGSGQTIWVGTENGLLQVNESSDMVLKTYHTNNSGLSHNTIRAVYEGKDGVLWVGTYDKLNRLPALGKIFQVYDLKGNYKPGLKNNLISGEIKPASPQSDSLLWVGTETGLCLFNTRTKKFEVWHELHGLKNEVIKCIYLNDKTVWLGTDFGLHVFDSKTKKARAYFHDPKLSFSIANNAIWQIFEDRSETVWLATSNGLSRISKRNQAFSFQYVSGKIENQQVGNQIRSILYAGRGVTWVATLHGVHRIDKNGNITSFGTQTKNPILLNNSYTLEEDTLGRIWIGTAGGINIWDESQKRMHSITADHENGLRTNYVARIVKGTDGSMWVATFQGGLLQAVGDIKRPEKIRFRSVNQDFGSEKMVAGNGVLWLVHNNEIFRVDEKTGEQNKMELPPNIKANDDIYCLYFDTHERLWAGMQNGLLQLDTKNGLSSFLPLETGRDVEVGALVEDGEGNMWGATNHFIFRHARTGRIGLYPLEKGLPLKSFYHGCTAKRSGSELLFGGDNGFVTVNTHETAPYQFEPNVYITSVEINNKAIKTGDTISRKVVLTHDVPYTKSLVLDYANRSLMFKFASLHFWQPEMNIYAYKLEGFDDNWIHVSGARNFAVYSNLSPGKYLFHVRGTNNHGIWSASQASMLITIKPPIWLSPVSMLLYVILAIAATVLALRVYSARLKLRNALSIAILEKNHMEELARIKQQFFTNISHELRTPISLIMPPLHQILIKGKLDEETRSLIKLAEKNSHRLLRVINQILDFRKLESHTLHLKVGLVNVVNFCREIHSLFQDKANRRKVDFSFESLERDVPVWIDSEKIETVLFNLLSNAFKFTPHGGAITVTVFKEQPSETYPEGCAVVSVSDTGVGLYEEEKKHLFEPFYQYRDARARHAGNGIGLALAFEYIKLHHGNIQVDSVKGMGATFTIFLPLGKKHLPVDISHDEQEVELIATRELHSANEPTHFRFDLQSNKPLILIMDDSNDMIELVRISLGHKYNFISAENGEDGLKKTVSAQPEIVIGDVKMPVMDGLGFCKKIKENPRTRHISIILISGQGSTSQKVEGIRKGADAYLIKPFEMEYLEAHIDHLLTRKIELEHYLRSVLYTHPEETGKENEDEKFIKKLMSTIEANISDSGFGVEQLSEEMAMSASYLYRRVKSLTRLSTHDVIKKYRLKKASILLRNKGGNVTEIMYDVGFANLSYFSKCFKAEYGLNPKDYQQQMSRRSIDLNIEQ